MEPKRTEFRKRMDQFKKAREANPQLSYWEWKAIPKYEEGTDGVDNITDDGTRPATKQEQDAYFKYAESVIPGLTAKDKELMSKGRNVRVPEISAMQNKGESKEQNSNREVNLIMDSMNDMAEKENKIADWYKAAYNVQEQERRKTWQTYKKGIDATMTAAELVSSYYMLGKGAKLLGWKPNSTYIDGVLQSDKAQIYANSFGTTADAYQLVTSNNTSDKIENGIELPLDVAGIIGGTNWFRNTNLFGKYGNTIDNVMDSAGFTAGAYDGIMKPFQWLYNNYQNTKDKNLENYSDGTDGVGMTPEQQKKFLEDRQKYARMSGAISPVINTRDAIDMTPLGNAAAMKDIYDATIGGNYLDAGLIGASLVVPAAIAKPARKYIPTVTRTAAQKINALLDKSKVLKETDWNNTINRSIERIYDKDVRDRAAQIKSKYGVDIQSQYDMIDDMYTNNYENIPKAKIIELQDGSRARMQTNAQASKAWATEGKPAGAKDFEMQVRSDVEPSREITDHEINHWWTYTMMQNPDWRRSELQKITKDFEGALHNVNPLDPDNSKYYKDWMEQNAYGINVVNSMKELGIPFTKENVIKFINQKPDTSAQKRAAKQFKNMDLYYDWLRTMPLAGMAGAAYLMNNKEDKSN